MAHHEKSIVRKFYDILSTGDLDAADKIVAADYVNHNAIPGQAQGLEGFKQAIASLRTAFPDLEVTIEDQVAEGDRVASRYSVRGTHKGAFLGVEATGKTVSWSAQVHQRVADGRVQESWLQWDQLGLLEQLRAT
jgi:steroid delta-isomerase-like uncharacterized protein